MSSKGKEGGKQSEVSNPENDELSRLAGELVEKRQELPAGVPENCRVFVEHGFNFGDKLRRLDPHHDPTHEWEVVGFSAIGPFMELKRTLDGMISYSSATTRDLTNGWAEKIEKRRK